MRRRLLFTATSGPERGLLAPNARVQVRDRLVGLATVALGLLIVSASLFSPPLFAHHSSAIFDAGKRVTVVGTITEWFWANPHCLLSFDVEDANGQVVHWVAETQAPPNMIPRGWSRQSFEPGDQVTLTVDPARSGQPVGRLIRAVFPDGTTLVPGGSAGAAAATRGTTP